MGAKSSKAKGGARKHGRDQNKCARYKVQGRREKNKCKRIEKEARRQARLRARKEGKQSNEKGRKIRLADREDSEEEF